MGETLQPFLTKQVRMIILKIFLVKIFENVSTPHIQKGCYMQVPLGLCMQFVSNNVLIKGHVHDLGPILFF